MSSQVVSLAVTREKWSNVRGVVLYVFPMRWRNLLDDTVGHLRRVPAPMLFVQGGRDEEFAELGKLRARTRSTRGPCEPTCHRGGPTTSTMFQWNPEGRGRMRWRRSLRSRLRGCVDNWIVGHDCNNTNWV